MKILMPKYNGRPMKFIKKYKSFILFIDEKTGIKECYQYWDLMQNINKKRDINTFNDNNKKNARHNVKNDLRLSEIIKEVIK